MSVQGCPGTRGSGFNSHRYVKSLEANFTPLCGWSNVDPEVWMYGRKGLFNRKSHWGKSALRYLWISQGILTVEASTNRLPLCSGRGYIGTLSDRENQRRCTTASSLKRPGLECLPQPKSVDSYGYCRFVCTRGHPDNVKTI